VERRKGAEGSKTRKGVVVIMGGTTGRYGGVDQKREDVGGPGNEGQQNTSNVQAGGVAWKNVGANGCKGLEKLKGDWDLVGGNL